MTERALVAGNEETVTPWLAETLATLGYETVATAAADSPEDGQYYLSPGIVERVEELLDRTGAPTLVVDGDPHVGQLTDLRERVTGVEIRDRRRVVWERLESSNPVAETRLALEDTRLKRRLAERAGRRQARQSPDGTSGRVADLDRQCERLRDELADRQQDTRTRVTTAHTDADAYVVLAETAGTGSPIDRRLAFDGEPGPADSPPVRAETGVGRLGVHRVAVTDIPAVPWLGHVPDWFEAVVPGAIAALERADIVCSTTRPLAETLATNFEATPVTVEQPTRAEVRQALTAHLGTVDIDVSFPYADEAHAAVSWLHDRTAVRSVAYEERIALSLTAPAAGVAAIERRIRDAGGRIEDASTPDEG